jgi:hypothetical protein
MVSILLLTRQDTEGTEKPAVGAKKHAIKGAMKNTQNGAMKDAKNGIKMDANKAAQQHD